MLRHLIPTPDAATPEEFCLQVGADLWYDPQSAAIAKRVCNSGCPVRDQCLADALDEEHDERWSHGVRGGLMAHERRKIINARKRQSGAA